VIKLVGIWVVLMLAATWAEAAPPRVLVLPLDGNAEPALRAKLNLAVQKLARKTAGNVANGDTTFAETAAAVGCDPAAADCAETVRTTLGVDELVWGTATWTNGQTNLVVYRSVARQPTRSGAVLIGPREGADKADAGLAPLFGEGSTTVTPDPTDPLVTDPRVVDPLTAPAPQPPQHSNRKRTKGIILSVSGGVALVIGLSLWSNKSSVQQDIDDAPTDDAADFARLEELESRAFTYAMVGNVMVLGGLALGGYGGWILYQDRKERQVAVTPQLTATSAGVTVGGTW